MNKLLDPFEAQALYPDAWQHIVEEMMQARDGYATRLVPVAAEVLNENGDKLLQVIALSDISIEEDGENSLAQMIFRAKLA
jgi:hypothetical protein